MTNYTNDMYKSIIYTLDLNLCCSQTCSGTYIHHPTGDSRWKAPHYVTAAGIVIKCSVPRILSTYSHTKLAYYGCRGLASTQKTHIERKQCKLTVS